MSEAATNSEIRPEAVSNIIKALGYEVLDSPDDGVFSIRGSSGIRIVCAVEESILNCTVPLVRVDEAKITREVALSMLASDNKLATSHIELVKQDGGKVRVVLMNYCKLQELGDDDVDDIETALEFIELDTLRAKNLLAGITG